MNGFSRRMPILLLPLVGMFAMAAVSVSAQSTLFSPFRADTPEHYQFTKIRIRHSDARMIAEMITQSGGIIVVPPNYVYAAGSSAPSAASPALPPGVRRIFVLESDNSLVIEATSEGLAALSR